MKNKKTVLWLVLIAITAVSAYSQQYDSEKDFKVEKDPNVKGGVVITQYLGSKSEVRIPPSIQKSPVTGIGVLAFVHRTGLTSITIPDSVTSIGDYAFQSCASLTSITIGSGITSIGWGSAFVDCASLSAINIDSGNANYSSDQGVLYNKDKTELIFCPRGKAGAFTIPNGVTSIGWAAFRDCANLTGLIIPNSVTSIGESAFYQCAGLTSVTIPNSVTSIMGNAFYGCTNLTGVTFEGIISSDNFGVDSAYYGGSGLWISPFDGDLRAKYLAGGKGTYRRPNGKSTTWTKQK